MICLRQPAPNGTSLNSILVWLEATAKVEWEYGIKMASAPSGKYQAVIAAVSHNEYAHLTEEDFAEYLTPDGILVDIKGKYKGKITRFGYWSL